MRRRDGVALSSGTVQHMRPCMRRIEVPNARGRYHSTIREHQRFKLLIFGRFASVTLRDTPSTTSHSAPVIRRSRFRTSVRVPPTARSFITSCGCSVNPTGLCFFHGDDRVVETVVGKVGVRVDACVRQRCVLVATEGEHGLVHLLGVEDPQTHEQVKVLNR